MTRCICLYTTIKAEKECDPHSMFVHLVAIAKTVTYGNTFQVILGGLTGLTMQQVQGNASLDSIALPVLHHLNKSHVGGHMYTVPVAVGIPHQYRGDITHQLVGILSPMLLIRQQGTCSHHQKMVA